jgi:hypothetical protein
MYLDSGSLEHNQAGRAYYWLTQKIWSVHLNAPNYPLFLNTCLLRRYMVNGFSLSDRELPSIHDNGMVYYRIRVNMEQNSVCRYQIAYLKTLVHSSEDLFTKQVAGRVESQILPLKIDLL